MRVQIMTIKTLLNLEGTTTNRSHTVEVGPSPAELWRSLGMM